MVIWGLFEDIWRSFLRFVWGHFLRSFVAFEFIWGFYKQCTVYVRLLGTLQTEKSFGKLLSALIMTLLIFFFVHSFSGFSPLNSFRDLFENKNLTFVHQKLASVQTEEKRGKTSWHSETFWTVQCSTSWLCFWRSTFLYFWLILFRVFDKPQKPTTLQ